MVFAHRMIPYKKKIPFLRKAWVGLGRVGLGSIRGRVGQGRVGQSLRWFVYACYRVGWDDVTTGKRSFRAR